MPYRLHKYPKCDNLLNSLVTVTSGCLERKKDALCEYSYNQNTPNEFKLYIIDILLIIQLHNLTLEYFISIQI